MGAFTWLPHNSTPPSGILGNTRLMRNSTNLKKNLIYTSNHLYSPRSSYQITTECGRISLTCANDYPSRNKLAELRHFWTFVAQWLTNVRGINITKLSRNTDPLLTVGQHNYVCHCMVASFFTVIIIFIIHFILTFLLSFYIKWLTETDDSEKISYSLYYVPNKVCQLTKNI